MFNEYFFSSDKKDAERRQKQHFRRITRNHRAMKDKHKDRFTLRLSAQVRQRIAVDAAKNGRTETGEIVARLEDIPLVDLVEQLIKENAEIKAMLRLLLHEHE